MRGLPSLLLLLSLLGTLGGLLGCASSDEEPEPVWVGTEVDVASDRVLWKIALFSCQKLDFPVATSLDPATMEITTDWGNDLQPFRGMGTRAQAHVKMTPQGPGKWRIEARVKRQVNMTLKRPLELASADWEWTVDDVDRARILVQHIRAYVDPTIDLQERPEDEVEAFLQRAGLGEDGEQ